MVTRARVAPLPRMALAAEDERTGAETARVAAARGLPVERLGLEAAIDAPVGAILYAPAAPPAAAAAARLAPLAQAAAERRRPLVLLAAFERARGRLGDERAAALAFLAAHGAIPVDDPDAWFETAVLVAAHGVPLGPRVAVVAPPGGWLALAATALSLEEEARGGARLPVADAAAPPADIVLVDAGLDAPAHAGRALVVPIVARAEMAPDDGRPVLCGLRASLAAAAAAGRHAERLAAGLGPAPIADVRRLRVDRARADKALAHAGDRLGDHETKLLLSAYGASVNRQAVAQTPSAAVRYAQQIGFPVELVPWEPTLAGAAEPVAARNPPEVRRGFAAVATAAGLAVGVPVIVRAPAAPGRAVRGRVERLPELGPTLLADIAGAPRPLAAPAPLRRPDADEIAATLIASRAGDAPPDRAALAELLIRASFAAVEHDLELLDLERVVVASRGGGAMVMDARARLRRKP